jgi:hypothetical protein
MPGLNMPGEQVQDVFMSCICVLGMHRSGTSCLTGIMQNFGVELGEVFTDNLHNKRGNRENGRIVILNDVVLATNQGAWNNPVVVSTWTREEAGERDRIIKELEQKPSEHWGFKDTRTLFTLPLWLDAVKNPKFIGTFRHPHRVALSLNNRDGAPLEDSWNLWYQYNQRLMELVRQYGFALVDFDQDPETYLDDTLNKLIALGLDPQHASRAREFFDPELRNQISSNIDNVSLPAPVLDLYDELQAYNRSFTL